MSLKSLKPFEWGILRGVLDLDIVRNAQSFLRGQLTSALAAAGVLTGDLNDEQLGRAARDLLVDSKILNKLDDNQVSVLRGQFPLQDRLSESLMSVAHNVITSGAFKDLVGTTHTARMHMPIMARFVLPGNSEAGVPAHFDKQYNSHMEHFVTVWAPLVPVDSKCGGVRIYDQTRNEKMLISGNVDTSSGLSRSWHTPLDTEGLTALDCVPMSPGDLLYFGNEVFHESMPNISERTRLSLDMRFLLEGSISTKSIFDFHKGKTLDPEMLGE